MDGLGSLLLGNIPVMIMLLVGVGLLVFEMYVPGFGVPGISGIALLVLGFILLGPTLAQGLVQLLDGLKDDRICVGSVHIIIHRIKECAVFRLIICLTHIRIGKSCLDIRLFQRSKNFVKLLAGGFNGLIGEFEFFTVVNA